MGLAVVGSLGAPAYRSPVQAEMSGLESIAVALSTLSVSSFTSSLPEEFREIAPQGFSWAVKGDRHMRFAFFVEVNRIRTSGRVRDNQCGREPEKGE
jgi:hypothetical protein